MSKYDLGQVLDFLRLVRDNNNIEWMRANRGMYETARDTFKELSSEILVRMQVIDPQLKGLEVKDCIFRFNRDTRFSPDKAPYKRHFGVYYVPGGKKAVGAGYYLHIQPQGAGDFGIEQSIIDFGLYAPPPKIAKIVREEIFYGAGERMQQFLGRPDVRGNFSMDQSAPLKVLPKNLKGSPYDSLIRLRNWDLHKNLADSDLLSENFADMVVEKFAIGLEWNQTINEIINGLDED